MQHYYRLGIFAAAALLHFGCGDGDGKGTDGPGDDGNGDFVSANPAAPTGRDAGEAPTGGTGAGGTGGLSGAPGNDGGEGDPSRAIEEADIVKIDSNRLYALAQYGGLSVIDVSVRDELKLLGRFKTDAMPFEMYLRGDVVLGLFNSYGSYEYDEATGTYTWVQSSRILALDVSDPSNIVELASFPIPGTISDSRIVGDVLYVVGYEDTYCWGCDTANPGTTILSLDISNPMEVQQVDSLRYRDPDSGYGNRSVTVTEDRMYVAGVEYSNTGELGSTINVIDISDPGGTLVAAARVEAEGQISSRWQMDEYDGVLRVVSQTPQWAAGQPPAVQTWQIVSSTDLQPLGRTTLTLPRPETLQSVRFDGPRGYAITFEQTDPLFTIDLSDPAQPKQVGELEMPGWVYHMEPRGDRLLGLGFDQGNPDGAVTVSLFDVSNLATPTMLDRVNFGGDWGQLAEDQNRIHKAFNVLDDLGTILVPYSGFDYDTEGYCGKYTSGVQLIDWSSAEDDLTLRGAAAAVGQARRGILHDERLFAISDERVQTFDITDRDAPGETANLTLLSNVVQSVIVGEHVVRLSIDWWSSAPRLEVTTLAEVENPAPLGALDLTPIFGTRTECYSYGYPRQLFSNGQYAYLVYDSYELSYDYEGSSKTSVAIIDVSDPENPTLAGKHAITTPGYSGAYYNGNIANTGKDIVQIGTTLASMSSQSECADTDCTRVDVRSFVDVFDLSNPAQPSSVRVEVPVGLGTTGLLVSGNYVALSHYEAVGDTTKYVRFYLDRIDVTNPAEPALLPKVNVPGSLLAYDDASAGVIAVDYALHTEAVANYDQCYQRYGWEARFEPLEPNESSSPGRCTVVRQTLKLVRLGESLARVGGSHTLDLGKYVGQAATGDDRTFVSLRSSNGYAIYDGCYGCWNPVPDYDVPVVVLAGLTSGDFAVGSAQLQGGDYWSQSPLVASGTRALLATGWRGKLSVIDAENAAEVSVVKEVDVNGYVSDLDASGDLAVASLGQDGTQLIDLSDP